MARAVGDATPRHGGRDRARGVAVGAAAVGGFAIGRLSVGRLAVGHAKVGRLSVDEVEIGRLRRIDHAPREAWRDSKIRTSCCKNAKAG